MKERIFFTLVFVLCTASGVLGQELLTGGNMQDSTAWKVADLDSYDHSEYEFNYTADGPTDGKDGCLEVTCAGMQSTNILFFQELALIGGAQYEVKGAFKDLGGTLASFWCEILYDVAAPPEGPVDFGGTLIVGFNTWDGTKAGIDGTFQDDYAKGPGPVFTALGEAGLPVTIYFAINIGCWTGGSPYSFDVAIDEMSLTPVGGTDVEANRISIPDRFSLYQNFPNPFNPTTTIRYTIPKAERATLKIVNLMNQEVAVLVDGTKPAGEYEIRWNASGLSGGVYVYRLKAGEFVESKKLLLLK